MLSYPRRGRKGEAMQDMVTIDRRLYRTEDDRLVPEGDPAARWLWSIPGTRKPRAEAERLGALKPEAKQEAPKQNKARRPAGNKEAD